MRRRKRTKKAYTDLYTNPRALFPGLETIIYPNGEPEIWFTDNKGHGVCVKASIGPAGMGLTITNMFGRYPLTTRVYGKDYQAFGESLTDVKEVCITSYNPDERSQAFSRWYDDKATDADIALLGEEYRRRLIAKTNPAEEPAS